MSKPKKWREHKVYLVQEYNRRSMFFNDGWHDCARNTRTRSGPRVPTWVSLTAAREYAAEVSRDAGVPVDELRVIQRTSKIREEVIDVPIKTAPKWDRIYDII